MTFEDIIAKLPKPYYQEDGIAIYHLTTTPISGKLSLWRCRDGNDRSGNSEAMS